MKSHLANSLSAGSPDTSPKSDHAGEATVLHEDMLGGEVVVSKHRHRTCVTTQSINANQPCMVLFRHAAAQQGLRKSGRISESHATVPLYPDAAHDPGRPR